MRTHSARLFVVFIAYFVACAAAFPDMLALIDVSVVDIADNQVHKRQTVLLENDFIVAIGPSSELKPPADADVRELDGKYLIPGLWDMHFHPEYKEDLDLLLINGVLGARSMMGEPQHLAWRAEIELGMHPGPRLLLAGPIIEGHPPPELADVIGTEGRRLLSTRSEAIQEVQRQHAAGFDYLKVYNNLPVEAYNGLIAEGARLGMPVVGHVPIEVGLYDALTAGQLSVEHLRGSIQNLVQADAPVQPDADLRSRTLAWQFVDPDLMTELVRRTVASGTFHCPTLMARLFFSPAVEVKNHLARPESRFFQPRFRFMLENRDQVKWLSNFSEEDFVAARRGFKMQHQLIRAFQAAGVPLLAGTDMGPWGFSLHDELEAMVEAGLTPQQALVAAVVNPARFAEMQDTMGYIGTGARADLVVLDANPLEDIGNTRKIQAVIAGGKYLDRPVLDAMLEELSASPNFGRTEAFDKK